MIFNYNLGPGGRYELEFVISSCIYKIDYFTIVKDNDFMFESVFTRFFITLHKGRLFNIENFVLHVTSMS